MASLNEYYYRLNSCIYDIIIVSQFFFVSEECMDTGKECIDTCIDTLTVYR